MKFFQLKLYLRLSIVILFCSIFDSCNNKEDVIEYSEVDGYPYSLTDKFPEHKIRYNPKKYICYKTSSPIKFDGKLDDKAWSGVEWTDLFVDIEGDLKPNPHHKTKVKMLWDDNYFYFAAFLEEPHVWATIKKRDEVIFKDNDFEIFIDPDGDTHNYYELEVNAHETEWDLLLLKPYHDILSGKSAVDSWDIPGLITKVHVNGTINNPADIDSSWTIEIAIPWKALEECAPNKKPLEGEQWKVNFSRVHWDTDIDQGKYIKKEKREYNWVWSPQGYIAMHTPETWGLVQFTESSDLSDKIQFSKTYNDDIKWALRQLYKNQRTYYHVYKKYSASLRQLNLENTNVKGVNWPPEIVITPSGWEASLVQDNKKYIIQKNGKVWFINL